MEIPRDDENLGDLVQRAEEAADAWVRGTAGYFADGEATLEHVETHAWGDTVGLLVHRHADPLVSPLELDELTALLRR